MRIARTDAKAFGPFRATSLEFAPGLTVVFGPNESGKSTLHAATYAGVCGRRRGPGAGTAEDRAFKRKHQPWDGDSWSVGSLLELSDGRSIELSHDLLGGVNCRAVDAALGQDVSAEIMYDGAPDGARYLGLNRRSFGSVAVVRQAEMLSILEAADGLQQELQRAATSRSGDRPAAGAISAIETYFAEQVGSSRAHTKPLRVAQASVQRAQAALDEARAKHEEYLGLLEEAEESKSAARRASAAAQASRDALDEARTLVGQVSELARLRVDHRHAAESAGDAQQRCAEAEGEADLAQELHDRFGGKEPAGLGDGDQLAQQVSVALDQWQHAPDPQPLDGESSEELRAQLADLPERPSGDTSPHPDVRRSAMALATARRVAAQRVPVSAPEPLSDVEQRAEQVGVPRLRELATALQAAVPVDRAADQERLAQERLAEAGRAQGFAESSYTEREAALRDAEGSLRTAEDALAAARAQHSPGSGGPNVVLLVVGAVLAVGGAALLGTSVVLGVALLAAGIAIVAAAVRSGKAGQRRETEASVAEAEALCVPLRQQVAAARTALASAAEAVRGASTHTATAEERARIASEQLVQAQGARQGLESACEQAGVPADAETLRSLASTIESGQRRAEDHARHERLALQEQQDIEQAERHLASMLQARGASGEGTPEEQFTVYEQECSRRADQAQRADQRPGLQSRLAQRLQLEAGAARAAQSRAEAFASLAAAAVAVGAAPDANNLTEADADRLTSSLRRWGQDRSHKLEQSQQEQRDWSRLQHLLGEGTLDDLMAALAAQQVELGALQASAAAARDNVREAERGVSERAVAIGMDVEPLLGAEGVAVAQQLLRTAMDHSTAADAAANTMRQQASAKQARAEAAAQGSVSVPDAETDLAEARAEQRRVEGLREVLEQTRKHLTAAQERVHRDIAPVLGAAIADRLGPVTGGRYSQVRIHPETLAVTVAPPGGPFVAAEQLSHGTTEQIYLLVRIALAEMLGSRDETCPLLLDDVTVHADADRTAAIMDALLALAEERQIILFSQEAEVLQWAEQHLADSEQHAIITLEPVPTSGVPQSAALVAEPA